MYMSFVLVVLAGFIPTLYILQEPLTSPIMLTMIALGALFIFIGVVVFEWITLRNRLSLYLTYFLVQLAIATTISMLSCLLKPTSGGCSPRQLQSRSFY